MHQEKSAVQIGKESSGISSDCSPILPVSLQIPTQLKLPISTSFTPNQPQSQILSSIQIQPLSSPPLFSPNPPTSSPTQQYSSRNLSHHERFSNNSPASQTSISSTNERSIMIQNSSSLFLTPASPSHNQNPSSHTEFPSPSPSKFITHLRCVRLLRVHFRILIILSLPSFYFFLSYPHRSSLIDFLPVIYFSSALLISLNLAIPRLPSIRLFFTRSLPVKLCSSFADTSPPQPILWSIGSKPKAEKSATSGFWVQIYSNGDVYEGEFHEGKCWGNGVYHYHLCGRYEGDWVNGKYDGYGVETWARGSRYRGQYRQGLRHGIGIYRFYTGDVYAGEWCNGQSYGCGVHTCKDGSRYIGEFKWGVKHGLGQYHFRNGDIYAGEYFADKMHGFGVYQFQNGHRYEGAWHEGRRQGLGVYTFRNGETQSGHWQNGILDDPKMQNSQTGSPSAVNHAKVLNAVQDARRAAEKAYNMATMDERLNKVVTTANKAANAARVAAIKAVQNRMHQNSNDK
ncbi:hypothetical protein L6164_028026 [Bauhinia variegata]|uniref:Uncharacterized protein n=1 Tax=Bauhinia variegata TaxID=167791 RepID=A0ACB9LWH7_BAUVA|nr:hypothetical protein L6164_028026 [Bauhinia variegata]